MSAYISSAEAALALFASPAAEATAAAANGTEIPVYNGGVFNIEAVSIAGTALATSKYDAARAKASKNNIELSKV